MKQTATKICSTCKVEKFILDFTANKNQPSGYMCYCKSCNNERNKKYRKGPTSLKTACKRIFSYLNKRHKNKGHELDFSAEFLEELYKKQEGLCAYTKEVLELSAGKLNTLSVDRVDSAKGYIKENVVLTTWVVNNAKQDMPLDYFISMCEKVYKNGKK
jgi:hypothetical protein